MSYRMALSLGCRLSDIMAWPLEELEGWAGYAALEPFGAQAEAGRMTRQTAALIQTMRAMGGDKSKKPIRLEDLDPTLTPDAMVKGYQDMKRRQRLEAAGKQNDEIRQNLAAWRNVRNKQ